MTDSLPKNKAEGLAMLSTPGGLRLGVRPIKGVHLYEAAWETGATLPEVLQNQRWTNVDRTLVAIREYLTEYWDNYNAEVEKAKLKKLKAKREDSEVAA